MTTVDTAQTRCCVCGVVTDTLCGPCRRVGFGIFFCSAEHQRLVWFAHKKVCGENAMPFRFPPLTSVEAEQAKAYASRPYDAEAKEGAGVTEGVTPYDIITDELGITGKARFEIAIDILASSRLDWVHDVAATSAALCSLRKVIFRDLLRLAKKEDSVSGASVLAQCDPFMRIGETSEIIADALREAGEPYASKPFPVETDWYISFHHLAVVLSALKTRYVAAEGGDLSPKTDEGKRLFDLMSKAVQPIIQMVMHFETIKPAVGAALRKGMDDLLDSVELKLGVPE